MGNRIGRVVFGLILGIAALVVIYLVLPGNVKHPLQEWFQKTFQSKTYAVAEKYQKTLVPDHDITFGDMMANVGSGSSWVVDVIDEDESTGSYEVHAYTYKIDLRLEQENGQDNLRNLTQVGVEIQFDVSKKSDGSYVTSRYLVKVDDQTQDDFYKKQILDSLVGQAKSAKSDGK